MTIEKVNEAVELAKAVDALVKETGVISCDPYTSGPCVQMAHEDFLETFADYSVKQRRDMVYPFNLEMIVDGVTFFTVLSQEEYDGLGRE